jgi:DNA polymerase-3 subunit gamma/tau
MFENVLGQEKPIGQIRSEFEEGTLPRAMLFYGDRYTGKLTSALELARVLQCERKSAEWNCPCRSCSLHRPLGHHALVLAGPADFLPEIEACADVLKRNDQPAARFLFVRSLRKLVRRFDAGIWEANEGKQRKSFTAVSQLEDAVEAVLPGSPLPEPKELEKMMDRAVAAAKTLQSVYPADNIPIDTVRNIVSWAHTSQAAEKKVVILENADRMVEGSRNSLLKILEEPPKDTYFIIITIRKGAVIPTILSRLRHYYFPDRPRDLEKKVLEKIFRETTGTYETLEEYFLGWKNISRKEMLDHAESFLETIEGVEGSKGGAREEIEEYLLTLQTKEQARAFFSTLFQVLEERLIMMGSESGDVTAARGEILRQEGWNRKIREALVSIEQYNLRPSKTLTNLLQQMRNTP